MVDKNVNNSATWVTFSEELPLDNIPKKNQNLNNAVNTDFEFY